LSKNVFLKSFVGVHAYLLLEFMHSFFGGHAWLLLEFMHSFCWSSCIIRSCKYVSLQCMLLKDTVLNKTKDKEFKKLFKTITGDNNLTLPSLLSLLSSGVCFVSVLPDLPIYFG
jgi:hypothetical protein